MYGKLALGVCCAILASCMKAPTASTMADAPMSAEEGLASRPETDDVDSWIRKVLAEYPNHLLRSGERAEVEMLLSVNPAGRIDACRILKTSNDPVVDRTACASMAKYARFKPARDEAGRRVRADTTFGVTYYTE